MTLNMMRTNEKGIMSLKSSDTHSALEQSVFWKYTTGSDKRVSKTPCSVRERLKITRYLTISEISEKMGIKARRINALCLEGRIEGSVKFGNTWAIHDNAEKPKDERIKSGKYIKDKTDNEDIICHCTYL